MRKAIGIVRVSQVAGREGESFASPPEQRKRIEDACERDDLKLIETIEELDVSGGTPLEERAGLRRAVEAVESGEAQVVVAAYFDRLVRSLRVQDELVSRVEKAGGQVLAVDVGAVTNGSAGQWLSGTMLGAVSEYQRRTAAERSGEAQARAVARGVAPWPDVMPGYVRAEDGKLAVERKVAPIVLRAFELRAGGATIREVREYLRGHGIERSYSATRTMLASPVYLGEIRFGKLENLSAHEPIVPRDLWRRVQRIRVSRGRYAKSERLLARLGVLVCGGCGGRMSASLSGNGNGEKYPVYRCPNAGGNASVPCEVRANVTAGIVESVVVDAVRAALQDVEGRASAETNVRDAELALERAQADLDAAIRAFAGLEDETSARERLAELREERDKAQERLDRLGGRRASVALNAADDWDRLSVDERRGLIRATVERVTVSPGRGSDRVSVQLLGE
jgi:DNA invertase Pin-like site-specific DNA recombinase